MKKNSPIPSKAIGIISLGASGSSVFCNLVKHQCYQAYYIYDENLFKGGFAFNASSSDLLCNTSNNLNSIFYDEPLDFYNYLITQGVKTSEDDIVPRQLFSQYFTDRVKEYTIKARKQGVKVHFIKKHVTHIYRNSNVNTYRVNAGNDYRPISLDDIIDCRGVSTPMIPGILANFNGHSKLICSPYPPEAWLPRINENSKILVLGTRLSAVDTVILLGKRKCKVLMTSPSGKLPAVRNRVLRSPVSLISKDEYKKIIGAGQHLKRIGLRLIIKGLNRFSSIPRKEQITNSIFQKKALEEGILLDKQNKNHWKNLVMEFLGIINITGYQMTIQERERLKTIFKPLIETYLASFPTENAIKILKMLEQDQLEVRADVMEKVDFIDGKWRIHWKNGNYDNYDYIICAMGYHKPMIYETENGYILTASPIEGTAITITERHRVINAGTNKEERIWLAGVMSHMINSIPFFNSLTQQILSIIVQQKNMKRI